MSRRVPARTAGFQLVPSPRTGWKPVLRGGRLGAGASVHGGGDGAGAVERAADPAGEVAHVLARQVHAAVGAVEDRVMRLPRLTAIRRKRAQVVLLLRPGDRKAGAVVL